MHYTARMKRGFSLVELSIVLVILGLLTGGILAGQSLIRASELRSVAADLQRYQAAIYTFRDKYFAMPGDITNATKFWGVRAGTGSDLTCHQTISTFTGTCNGDGNGQVSYISGDFAMWGERFASWQHMAYAGLLEGSYTGASGVAAGFLRVAGTNMPRGKLTNSLFDLAYVTGPQTGSPQYFDGPYAVNVMMFMSTSSGSVLKPEEAWNIDTKMDDGKPATGSTWALKNTSTWSPGCTTTDAVSTAEYALTSTGSLCSIYFSLR
jgi:prepilin-type N-terminal cleavage/methylation domain-containing protein